jgi:uncharacterized membrane protein YfcA
VSGAIAIGLAAGVVAGLLGVGGGVLFVPGLVVFLGLSQHHAEATSLLAIVPVAAVGAYRQDRYGKVHRGDALLLGLFSVLGAAVGVALANALSGAILRDAFAALMLLVAAQLTSRALASPARHAGRLAVEDAVAEHEEVDQRHEHGGREVDRLGGDAQR